MAKIIMLFVFINRVSSWTVDMGEVEKILIDNEVQSIENTNENNYMNKTESIADIKNNFPNIDGKEIGGIIQNGSVYLDGLSKALMTYRHKLYNCSSNNTTSPEINETCRTVLNNTEYIQKLSELALLTTNKLRDKAYEKNNEDDDRNENELILQLAWLLDRLALLTGYEPNPKQYINNENSSTAPTTNTTDNTTITNKSTTDITESMEILEQTENGRPLSKLPPNLTTAKTFEKRSVDKPLENVAKYYVKFKVWNNSNHITDNEKEAAESYDVENNITVRPISKRSLQKIVILRRRVRNKTRK